MRYEIISRGRNDKFSMRLLRRGVYPEPAEGLLAMTLLGALRSHPVLVSTFAL